MNIDELAKKTKDGLYWNTVLKLIFQVIQLAVSVVIARLLDPFDFGVMAIGSMVVYYSNSLSDFGFINAIVQKKEIKPIQINSVFTLNFCISVLLTCFIVLLAVPIGNYFKSPESINVVMVLSSIFILKTFYDIHLATLRRSVSFKFIAKLGLFQGLFQSAIALLLAFLGMRYWSLVWATLISTLAATILVIFKSEWRPKFQYSHQEMKKIYGFGFWNFIGVQTYFVNIYVAEVIIGKYMGLIPLGLFEKAMSLSSIPKEKIAVQINAVMFSSFSRLQKDKVLLGDWFLKIVTVESVTILPILLGFYAVSQHFVIVLLGEKWRLCIIPLEILSLASIFQIFNGLIASLNVGVGDYKNHTICSIVMTILFVVLCVLARHQSVVAICWVYFFISVTWSVPIFRLARKNARISIKRLFKTILPYVLANIVMVTVVKLLAHTIFAGKNYINFILLVLIGVVCYSLLIMMINVLKSRSLFYPVYTKA
ncbi:lipopolysaccharide biosynthesis protein [Desulfonema magnum]|uniref:Polysaccharide biosynthesis protein n=1 Tax=Desulfonema magnum TaxID=45655 RepID=A0A975GKN6_9BACT|nr:lipopolysaccharide biosynthesis protein [Desulfonema magnum]QTA84837.1 putative polysaccharide biosynthesis protein [Desulfonema magnum]